MRLFLFLCASLLLVSKVKCTSKEGDCYLEGVEDVHWLTFYHNDPVDDFEEKEFKRFLIANVENVEIVEEGYGKYFNAKIENNHLLILPTDDYKNYEINEKSTHDPTMHVRLNFICKTGERKLEFYQPIRDSNSYAPEFLQRSYTYNLPMPLPAAFDIIAFGDKIVACDMDISNVRLHFANSIAEDFFISSSNPINDTNKCHEAIITTMHPLRLTNSKVYQITVMDTGIPSRNETATLTVEINEKNSLPLNPEFEYAYYIASYHYSEDQNHSIHVDNPIRLKEGCSNVNMDVLEEYKDNFRIGCDSNKVFVKLIRNLANETLKNNTVIAITIQATTPGAEHFGITMLDVYLKRGSSENAANCITLSSMECPSCTTELSECLTPIECPYSFSEGKPHSECTTTPETPTQTVINFQKDNYIIQARHYYEGYIEIVKAIVIPEEEVEYSIGDISNVRDAVECDPKTGVLKLTRALFGGMYTFTVYAEGVKTKVKTKANVKLSVGADGNSVNSIHSILVEHVTEEIARTEISLPCPSFYDCNYIIVEQYPETDDRLFTCDNIDLHVAKIDREKIDVPQFTLSLINVPSFGDSAQNSRLFNNSHVLSKRNINWENLSRDWVFMSSKIINTNNQLLVLIVIDDINDNPPTFEVGRKLIVGYPHKGLAALLAPPYLVKVSATDRDVGENATIRYSTKTSHFIIHSETGVVYPGKQAFDNEVGLKFNVTATDKNGAQDGLSTDLEIEVKLLTEQHIVFVTVENITLEDVDLFIANLSENTSMTVKYLTATVIPRCCCKNSSTHYGNNSINYSTRIFIYALNGEDELVEAYHLQKVLPDSKMLKNFLLYKLNPKTFAFDEGYYDSIQERKPAISDCIIINAILVLLLACFILAVGILYYVKVYKSK